MPQTPWSEVRPWCSRRTRTTRPSDAVSCWPKWHEMGAPPPWLWPPTEVAAGTPPVPGRPPTASSKSGHGEWHRALDALDVPKEGRFELGFADGTLSDHEEELAGRIGDLLRSLSPSQVFVTKPHDPHPDHQTLARATRRAVIDVYGSRPRPGSDGGRQAIHGDHPNGSPPEVYTYRVYPGEGLWPDGHPSQATLAMAVLQLARSVLGLIGRRPLILRAARSRSDKTAAIEAYESQRKLLDGELRYVWRTGVELYRPMNTRSDPSSASDRKPD